ncbi:MAG: hypothetical protein ACRDJ0_01660 [Actinomycetota bacterium]
MVGNTIFGGYVSAFVGAMVMTPASVWVSRLPSAMPPSASFLPGFWLLVPGALGLIGITELAGDGNAGTNDLVATAVSIFAVALASSAERCSWPEHPRLARSLAACPGHWLKRSPWLRRRGARAGNRGRG